MSARAAVRLMLVLVGLGVSAPAASAQAAREETVRYQNPEDEMPLVGTLALPPGRGPFPAVVLLSLAGVSEMIAGLNGLGWAVLVPERRGIHTIEQLLRASFNDLSVDVQAATAYLRSRPDVNPAVVGILAQGGETMAGALAAGADPVPAFVVLMSTTGLPGDETFRIEQHRIAQERNYTPDALAALDAYVLRLTELVVAEPSPGLRAFQVRALLGESDVSLPRNAAFPPNPEDQVRFFASLWWRELFLFRPDSALARIRSPVLVLMGAEDPLVPFTEQMPAIERGLGEAPTEDVVVCLLPGRIQHTITPQSLRLIESWLSDRLGATGFTARAPERPEGCLDPPRAGD